MNDQISKMEYNYLKKIYFKNKKKILDIRNSDKCFGDKARMVVQSGIIDNVIYARFLLNMFKKNT